MGYKGQYKDSTILYSVFPSVTKIESGIKKKVVDLLVDLVDLRLAFLLKLVRLW